MGGGSYSYLKSKSRSLSYSTMDSSAIFDSESRRTHKISQKFDIKGKVRESRDSEEHPESFPIIIALDVTGSMGSIPERLIKNDFPEIMKKILDTGIKHPQVCFCGVGDHECDDVPFQAGQFESSDELMESWLKGTYLEGGGGGNDGESYPLAWYFAAFHTDTDSFNKRRKKGVLITIGDEPYLPNIPKGALQEIFGEGEKNMKSSEAFSEALKKWDIYHINVMDYSGKYSVKGWKELLGNHLICTETHDGSDIIDIIPKLVIDSYGDTKPEVSTKEEVQEIEIL